VEAAVKVYIVGYNGNMARRYRAILEVLGHETTGEDLDRVDIEGWERADAFIVATPTPTHAEILLRLKGCGRPILCEKPLTKSMTQLETVLSELKRAGTRLQMVSQYDYLVDPAAEGETAYDYFRHGADGLFWDCINIVKHAKGAVLLAEKSPVWKCTINGQALNIRDMDTAYVQMIDHWLKDPTRTDYDEIFNTHKKVADLEAKWRAS
jgi:hypothetical protein